MLNYSKCEINCTLKCNLRCNNCNRMPQLFEKEDTDITIEQLDNFIEGIKGKGINTIKLLGGEPLLHKNFNIIYHKLTKALDNEVFQFLKIDHNHTQNIPVEQNHPKVRWMGKSLKKKKHLPVLWNPKDLGYKLNPNYNCPALKRCGYSLDYKGYLPCSPAIALVKLYHMEYLYKKEPPKDSWGLNELCPNCIMNMPDTWINENLYPVINTPEKALKATETIQNQLNRM